MTVVDSLARSKLIFISRGQAKSPERQEAVALIQAALHLDGEYNYILDGEFGPKTDGAVRQFQQKYGLTVDGRVGRTTAAFLDHPPAPKVQSVIPYETNYINNWNNLVIHPSKLRAIDNTIARITDTKHWTEYKKLESLTGVPPQVTAIIHERESGANLSTYLGNGQPLNRVTTIVPKGRGPFDSFVDGGVDAYRLEKMLGVKWRDAHGTPRLSYFVEKMNGFGYRGHGINSPYLYAGSNLYTRGKYTSDGHFDRYHEDTQLGAITIFKRMVELHPEYELKEV